MHIKEHFKTILIHKAITATNTRDKEYRLNILLDLGYISESEKEEILRLTDIAIL